MSNSSHFCQFCNPNHVLPALFVITRRGRDKVLEDICAIDLKRELKRVDDAGERGQKITYTTAAALAYFRELAFNRGVPLQVRNDGICSRPECGGEIGKATVLLFGEERAECHICERAAVVAESLYNGCRVTNPDTVRVREATNEDIASQLIAKVNNPAPKPQPAASPDQSERQLHHGGKRDRKRNESVPQTTIGLALAKAVAA